VQIRNHNAANAGETLQCESSDGGHSWSAPRPIGVWGMPSHLLRLRDGRLLMTYGYRRAPFGNLARISEDHRRVWSPAIGYLERWRGLRPRLPSTVELPNGEFVTVWYERPRDSPRAVLRKAQWSIA
jgi:sialidase-1